jgi:hypothetical protein
VEIVEGHVNTMGRPRRLISFKDSSANRCLVTQFTDLVSDEIVLWNETERFSFVAERVVVEVIGRFKQEVSRAPCRAMMQLRGQPDFVRVYESDTADTDGIRSIYILDASPQTLARIERAIREEGECVLVGRAIDSDSGLGPGAESRSTLEEARRKPEA